MTSPRSLTGNLGMNLKLTALATVSYRGKGATHNSGLQAARYYGNPGRMGSISTLTLRQTRFPENMDMDVLTHRSL